MNRVRALFSPCYHSHSIFACVLRPLSQCDNFNWCDSDAESVFDIDQSQLQLNRPCRNRFFVSVWFIGFFRFHRFLQRFNSTVQTFVREKFFVSNAPFIFFFHLQLAIVKKHLFHSYRARNTSTWNSPTQQQKKKPFPTQPHSANEVTECRSI